MKGKLTIISHIYNEEYFLPWWVNHHKEIADEIIFIDYASTDRSLEIIKDICPNCRIIPSRNSMFQADLVDQEVMDIESTIDGYKLCLNVTEFFIPKSDFSSILSNNEKNVYAVRRALMVDENENDIVLPNERLVERKRFGFIGDDPLHTNYRFLHNYEMGFYGIGRHYSQLPNQQNTESIIFVYTWSPWTDEMLKRKLQIKNKIPTSDKDLGRGGHHFWTLEEMTEIRKHFLGISHYIK